MWTDNIIWSWYETDTTVPDDKWLKTKCYIMIILKMRAGMQKNAYQHKIHHQIYILESNQRNYEKSQE